MGDCVQKGGESESPSASMEFNGGVLALAFEARRGVGVLKSFWLWSVASMMMVHDREL